MEDERASSQTDLVLFNKMFSFMFSFVRKCSRTKFFYTKCTLSDKTLPGKGSFWFQRPGQHLWQTQGMLRLEQEHELDL